MVAEDCAQVRSKLSAFAVGTGVVNRQALGPGNANTGLPKKPIKRDYFNSVETPREAGMAIGTRGDNTGRTRSS